ncbi:LAZ1 homolog 1-like protein isoform X1 [Tanacetum coccineum]
MAPRYEFSLCETKQGGFCIGFVLKREATIRLSLRKQVLIILQFSRSNTFVYFLLLVRSNIGVCLEAFCVTLFVLKAKLNTFFGAFDLNAVLAPRIAHGALQERGIVNCVVTDGTEAWYASFGCAGMFLSVCGLMLKNANSIEFVKQTGVAAVVHLYVFPAVPYKCGERCVRDIFVMTDYAALGAPPDAEEVQDCEKTPTGRIGRLNDRPKHPKLHHSVRDVVFESGEMMVDDMKFTVSHIVEPVERGIARINKTFHEISENVKRHEERTDNIGLSDAVRTRRRTSSASANSGRKKAQKWEIAVKEQQEAAEE